jgi:hypothetical protein
MQFLYPNFLFALVALAIPVIIHLFYFRRFKTVYFTNVRFLREVKEETTARQKIRNLLVLLMRCLAVAALVFAFAQPFIPRDVDVRQGQKFISVFLDNSFSMNALSEDVPLLEKARQRAREIISAYDVEDRFQILTNDFEGQHQRLVSKEEALTLLDNIKTSAAVRSLSSVVNRQQMVLNTGKGDNKIAYIISDFQRNITDIANFKDSLLSINLVPLQAVQEINISIDSAWFEAPVQMLRQPNLLVVKVRNWSTQATENIRLSIKYDGEDKPLGTLSIPAQSYVIDTVNVSISEAGWQKAELAITDYPVQFDDRYSFSFNVAEFFNVLVINENTTEPYLEAAFRGISNFRLTNQLSRSLDYSRFPEYQLIICNGLVNISSGLAAELKQYVQIGGNVLVFPSEKAELGTYRSFLEGVPANYPVNFDFQERAVTDVNTEEFVFRDVYENKSANLKLPATTGNFKLSNIASLGEEKLLTYRDGSPYLTKFKSGQGILYLCAAPLADNFNTLTKSGEVFIPMLYKMAISSARERPISYTIGKDEIIQTEHTSRSLENVYKLRGLNQEFIPQQRVVASKVSLAVQKQIRDAGFYDLYLNPDSVLAIVAFNYDRRESDLGYYAFDELQSFERVNLSILTDNLSANFSEVVGDRDRGIVLWKWFVILALIVLAIEILLLRFWKD